MTTADDVLLEPLRRADLGRLRSLTWSTISLGPIAYNQVGAFSLTVPMTDRVWDLIEFDEDGAYRPTPFLVSWGGVYQVPVFAEQWNPAEMIDDTTRIVSKTITFAGADMKAVLANRTPYRDPTKNWAAQTPGTTTVTGPAETVIKQLVQANVVAAGDTVRRFPNFVVAPDQGRGGAVTYTIVIKAADSTDDTVAATSDQDLMEMVRTVAAQSPIGVRIDLIDGQFVFDCYLPPDLSDRVVFSTRLGGLRSYSLTDAVPTSNAVLMQTGSGFVSANGPGADDPWRRVETYSDQTSTTDATQISQAQTDALSQGAAVAKVTATITDLPKLRFGDDAPGIQGWREGSIVAVDLHDGVTYTDMVTSVQLTADAAAGTATATPTIGAGDSSDTATDQTATAKLTAQVRALEKAFKQTQRR